MKCFTAGGKIKRAMETSQQMGKKRGQCARRCVQWRRGWNKKQLWRNNFPAIHQWAHVDRIDKLLITKSIAMNFHSCQTEEFPGERSPRDLAPPPLRSPIPHFCLTPTLPASQKLSCLKAKSLHQHFRFQSRTKQGKAARWPRRALIRAGQVLPPQKAPLSIAACSLHIRTNEAHRSLIFIPFDLTHFIDSTRAPNEMLNLPHMDVVPCSYCYGDTERRERRGNTTARKVFNYLINSYFTWDSSSLHSFILQILEKITLGISANAVGSILNVVI